MTPLGPAAALLPAAMPACGWPAGGLAAASGGSAFGSGGGAASSFRTLSVRASGAGADAVSRGGVVAGTTRVGVLSAAVEGARPLSQAPAPSAVRQTKATVRVRGLRMSGDNARAARRIYGRSMYGRCVATKLR